MLNCVTFSYKKIEFDSISKITLYPTKQEAFDLCQKLISERDLPVKTFVDRPLHRALQDFEKEWRKDKTLVESSFIQELREHRYVGTIGGNSIYCSYITDGTNILVFDILGERSLRFNVFGIHGQTTVKEVVDLFVQGIIDNILI